MPENNYIKEIEQVWELVKTTLVEEEKISNTALNLWFGDVKILSFENDTVTMGIESELKFDVIRDKYLSLVESAFGTIIGFPVHINLVFTGSPVSADQVKSKIIGLDKKENTDSSATLPAPDAPNIAELPSFNFEYTFENFIVGSTNRFAHAACVSVAKNPATNYNPLFIYGNSGLGKTHLMCAVVNQMRKNNPNVKIIYTKGEDFTNQMISCLANKTMEDFRDKYRKCDVLLIDDIQFIAGKVSTQEEFFHTFNALFEEKKQIILTSDRPPRDIKALEDRLKSRFEWGLLADIEPPDLELRIAIIKKKAEQVNVRIPNEVLTFLGENLRSNIRQIEGAIKKLGALSFLSGTVITMDVARSCIAELLDGAEPVSVTVEKIFSAVSRKYNVTKELLTGPKRNKEIANPRHISIYLIRELTEMSYPNIAKMFNRDHATIMTSWEKIHRKCILNTDFNFEINELRKEITGQ